MMKQIPIYLDLCLSHHVVAASKFSVTVRWHPYSGCVSVVAGQWENDRGLTKQGLLAHTQRRP